MWVFAKSRRCRGSSGCWRLVLLLCFPVFSGLITTAIHNPPPKLGPALTTETTVRSPDEKPKARKQPRLFLPNGLCHVIMFIWRVSFSFSPNPYLDPKLLCHDVSFPFPFPFLFGPLCRPSCSCWQVRRGIDVSSEKVKVLPPGGTCEVRYILCANLCYCITSVNLHRVFFSSIRW